MTSDNDQEFVAAAKRLLDEAADGLDTDTLARLQAARKRVVTLHAQRRQRWSSAWVPVGALAGGLAVAASLWFSIPPAGLPPTGIEDLELLAAPESIEFYADLDFFHWLTADSNAG